MAHCLLLMVDKKCFDSLDIMNHIINLCFYDSSLYMISFLSSVSIAFYIINNHAINKDNTITGF